MMLIARLRHLLFRRYRRDIGRRRRAARLGGHPLRVPPLWFCSEPRVKATSSAYTTRRPFLVPNGAKSQNARSAIRRWVPNGA